MFSSSGNVNMSHVARTSSTKSAASSSLPHASRGRSSSISHGIRSFSRSISRTRRRPDNEQPHGSFGHNVRDMIYPRDLPIAVEDLSRPEMETYARILRLDPAVYPSENEFKTRTLAMIANLEQRLRDPAPKWGLSQTHKVAILRRISASSNDLPKLSRLCSVHRQLNGQITASARSYIELHARDYLGYITSKMSPKAFKSLSTSTWQCIKAVEDCLAMSMQTYEWCAAYKRSAPLRFQSVRAACDACYLTAVSNSPQTLTGLRGVMITSRGVGLVNNDGRECSEAAIQWIDAWFETYDKRKVAEMTMTSEGMARELMMATNWLTRPSTVIMVPSRDQPMLAKAPSTSSSHTLASQGHLAVPLRSVSCSVQTRLAKGSEDEDPGSRMPCRSRCRNRAVPKGVAIDAVAAYRDYACAPRHEQAPQTQAEFLSDVLPQPLRAGSCQHGRSHSQNRSEPSELTCMATEMLKRSKHGRAQTSPTITSMPGDLSPATSARSSSDTSRAERTYPWSTPHSMARLRELELKIDASLDTMLRVVANGKDS